MAEQELLERIKYTDRGFSYVEVTPQEVIDWGGYCICDHCNGQFENENMYLSFVLADTFCKDCWEHILERQKHSSQEDVDHDLAIQKENSLDWYRYHLDRDYRNKIINETTDWF